MIMAKKKKSITPNVVYRELMRYKSFRESTQRTKEDKLKEAIRRRKKLRKLA